MLTIPVPVRTDRLQIRFEGVVPSLPYDSDEKKALIDARPAHRYKVRAQTGRGDVVLTTLLGKILTLVANKLATLDPFGVGIEMEADRPGWCDALNGLPGIFGSSVNETIELKRLVEFTLRAMPAEVGECPLPGDRR